MGQIGIHGLDRGLEISAKANNYFGMWWPGTESNLRRQPFQAYNKLYFQ
jgi:hypothetical protein